MAARRGRSQARRNQGPGIPGWAWLIAGLLLGIGVILMAPGLLKSDNGDGFFRPRPDPDAQPAPSSSADEDAVVPEATATDAGEGEDAGPQYDFYTLLPGDEVALSDAQLAASARAEAEAARQAREQAHAAAAQASDSDDDDAADLAEPPASPVPSAADTGIRYILQAGAFGASGDAEAVKARIALLGLSARVESAQIRGKTVYRVRMGPYGSASELAEAKRKLAAGGLPALAIQVK